MTNFEKYREQLLNFISTNGVTPARWVCKRVSDICEVGKCYKVEVQESEGNTATYVEY